MLKRNINIVNKYLWDINNPLGYSNRMGIYKTKKELSFIRKYIEKKKLKILDIGGGSGRFAIPLAKLGHDVVVIDISEEALRILKKNNVNIKSINQNYMDFTNDDEYYDTIIAIESLDYFNSSELPKVFSKIYSQLNPSGIFIFTITNSQSWRFKLARLFKRKNYFDNITYKEYISLLKDTHFRIIAIEGFVWMPFVVNSNSYLIKYFEKLELFFRLYKWINQSPWLLFAVGKL